VDDVVGILIDAADAAVDVADLVSRRRRRRGCLILTLIAVVGILIWYLVFS
jgi:hypothetical protein